MKRKLSKILGIALTVAMLTSLLISASPALALSQPQVALTPATGTIEAVTTYDVTYTSGTLVDGTKVAGADQIVLAFPAGTDITGLVIGNVTIQALAGIGTDSLGAPAAAFTAAPSAVAIVGTYPAAMTMYISLPVANCIGAGALVGVKVTGVKNPATPGSYTVSVATQTVASVAIEAAVVSASYAISAPGVTPLPGVVLAYNSAGILMSQSNSIQTAINALTAGGRIEVGAGTYDETIAIPAGTIGLTIVATGGTGTAIVKDASAAGGLGTLTISSVGTATAPVVIDGLTFSQSLAGAPVIPVTIAAGATYITIQNCTIEGGTTSAITSNGAGVNTVKNCTIDANGTGARVGIVANDQMTITGCTFDAGTADTGITSALGVVLIPTVISNNTFAGGGLGVTVTGGFASVTGDTFNALTTALTLGGGTTTVKDSTIDGCGGTAATPANAVQVNAGATLIMNNSTVKNTNTASTANYAFGVAAGATAVTLNFNNIIDNAKNINSAVAVTADHNYWGSIDGPASSTIAGVGVTTTVPVIKANNNNASVAYASASLATKTTIGVDVAAFTTGVPTAVGTIGVNKYSTNPEIVTPIITGTGSVLGYYDVYIGTPGGINEVQIKFYGAVTNYTKVYFSGGLGGQWSAPTTWGVNTAGGYAYVTITGATTPSIVDLAGLPFAIVEDKILAAPALTVAAGATPAIGAYEISVTPTFTWGAVVGADHYQINLCEDPSFTILEWAYNVDTPFFKADEALRNDTTYYWRVRGVLDAASTAFTPWATGIFTTEAEEVAAEAPITVEPVVPEVTVEIPPTKITVEPSAPAIPTYLLWIIVVVGAVLVIALIVLIVRTRRVA